MKALVLSGGSGTRLRPLTLTRSKQLLPIANRPLLHHVLDNIAKAGIGDVIVVTGNNSREIQDSVGDGSHWHLNLRFVTQHQPLGLAHAVLTAEEALEGEAFLMYLGDNILPGGIAEYLRAFNEVKPDTLVLLHPVENPQNFGIAVLDGNRLVRLVEKPAVPIGNLGLVGIYFFTPLIHEAIRQIKPSFRGELEITDAIQYQLEHGLRVEARLVDGIWHDAGKPEDLLEANRSYLRTMVPEINAEAEIGETNINGSLRVERGARITRSRIIGPVVIGRECVVEDAVIGPYASIGDGCQIRSSTIENSILLAKCRIDHTPPLTGCILGAETELARYTQTGKAIQLIGSDQTRLTFTD